MFLKPLVLFADKRVIGSARVLPALLAGASVLLLLGLSGMAQAQVAQQYWQCRAPSAGVEAGWCPVNSNTPLPISGTISASLAGFNPTAGATANLTNLVNTSQDVALPAGTDVIVSNKGSVLVNLRLQAGAGTAVSTDLALGAGAAVGFHLTTQTHLSAIAPTGTGTGTTAGQLNIQGGAGLVTGYGGGSSGGSTGGTVAIDQTTPGTTNGVYVNNTPNVNATIAAPFGSAVSASSVPVVIASDQASIPVTSGVAQNSNSSGQTGALVQGATTTGAPTYTTAKTNPLSLDLAGNLRTLDTLAAGSALAGKFGIDQTTPGSTNGVSPVAAGVGGATHFNLTAANSTNSGSIKGSAGTLYHVSVYNNSATPAYLSFFDSASATPTCTGTLAYQVGIPANSTSMAGAVEDIAVGLNFTTGIGYCVTTGIGGTGSVAATTYSINATFK